MAEKIDIERIIFENIENTYIINLTQAEETSTGSFWAVNESKEEYHISSGLAKENEQLITSLEFQINSCWALAQDSTWRGVDWKGKKVRSIMMMEYEKSKCELFKKKLKEFWELNFSAMKKSEESVNILKNLTDLTKSKQLYSESEQLRKMVLEKEKEMNSICNGWEDIDR